MIDFKEKLTNKKIVGVFCFWLALKAGKKCLICFCGSLINKRCLFKLKWETLLGTEYFFLCKQIRKQRYIFIRIRNIRSNSGFRGVMEAITHPKKTSQNIWKKVLSPPNLSQTHRTSPLPKDSSWTPLIRPLN